MGRLTKYKVGDVVDGCEILAWKAGQGYQHACPVCGILKWSQCTRIGSACWDCCTFCPPKHKVGDIVDGCEIMAYERRRGYQYACSSCGTLKWSHHNPIGETCYKCRSKHLIKYKVGDIINRCEILAREGGMYQYACPSCGTLKWSQGSLIGGTCHKCYSKTLFRHSVGNVVNGCEILAREGNQYQYACPSCGALKWEQGAKIGRNCKYCRSTPGWHYYVYIWRDPILGKVRYVGKGQNGRVYDHGFQDYGFTVEFPARNISEGAALDIEADLIRKFQPEANVNTSRERK